ncbi:MAG: TetR/AcrR family transcriptional regulator [bacterium]|nr:TetR/AcrR family transcriptional regulator [bacterium]
MRLTKEAWLDQGLMLLAEQGAASLTIDRLTESLGVTKGSFYHHFHGREEFSMALLAHWEKTLTGELIEATRDTEDFDERNKRLSKLGVKHFEPKLEVSVRAWALREPMARTFQDRVDRQRLDYLQELFRLITDREDLAKDLALIRYSFFVGAQQISPSLTRKQYARLLQVLQSQLLPLAQQDISEDGDSS